MKKMCHHAEYGRLRGAAEINKVITAGVNNAVTICPLQEVPQCSVSSGGSHNIVLYHNTQYAV